MRAVTMAEEWRVAMGVDISSHGRSVNRLTKAIYLPESWNRGYRRIVVDGKFVPVHKLVALAFLDDPKFPSDTIDHKNGDKANNKVSNLRWASKSLQRKNQKPHAQFQDTLPVEMNAGDGVWHRFACMSECCRVHDLDISAVSKCMSGKRKSHKGLIFRRVEPVEISGERWATIYGITVSTAGRIKNRKSGTIWMPKPTDGHGGYCYVADPLGKMHSVHRLVAQAFLSDSVDPAKPEVDHWDGDRGNNRVSNLRWANRIEQVKNRKKIAINSKNTTKAIRSIDSNGNVAEYPSAREATKATGVAFGLISRVALGNQKSSQGYKFEFV